MESVAVLKINDRQKALLHWLNSTCGLSVASLSPIEGAASFRRYFRINHGQTSLIAMDAPPSQENCFPYITIANTLRNMTLKTPEIFASDISQGFLLITDFGDTTYLRGLNKENADHLYGEALSSLVTLTRCEAVPGYTIPFFNREFMWQEWAWHKEWFSNKLLGLSLDLMQPVLDVCYERIVASIVTQPQVFMHRDFHSQNLMVLPKGEVGILDFQDAFIGPLTYDLVSLLRDCYIAWPEERVQKWVREYQARLFETKRFPKVSEEQFMQWFDWIGIERHLKALFTFARKYLRDGQSAYLAYMPRTLNYLIEVSKRYTELMPMFEYLNQMVMPAFTQKVPSCVH